MPKVPGVARQQLEARRCVRRRRTRSGRTPGSRVCVGERERTSSVSWSPTWTGATTGNFLPPTVISAVGRRTSVIGTLGVGAVIVGCVRRRGGRWSRLAARAGAPAPPPGSRARAGPASRSAGAAPPSVRWGELAEPRRSQRYGRRRCSTPRWCCCSASSRSATCARGWFPTCPLVAGLVAGGRVLRALGPGRAARSGSLAGVGGGGLPARRRADPPGRHGPRRRQARRRPRRLSGRRR